MWKTYSNSRFKKTLQVLRKIYQHILESIRHRLERKNINEEPITPEERLAICLYRLAITPEERHAICLYRLARGDYYLPLLPYNRPNIWPLSYYGL